MTDKAALKTSQMKSSGADAAKGKGATASASVKLPLLEEINHKFQGFLSQRLKAFLLHDVGVEQVSLSVLKAEDYLAEARKKALITSNSLKPLDGMVLITIDKGLLDSLVDNYFGGHGAYTRDDLGMGVSFVEYRMAERLLSSIYLSYEIVFSPLKNIMFGFAGFQGNPPEDKTVNPAESLIVSRFKVDTGSGCSFFEICFQNRTVLPIKKDLAGEIPSGFFNKLNAPADEEKEEESEEQDGTKKSRVAILARLKPVALASLINNEHPQVKAVILSSLNPEIAIKALTHVPFAVLSSLISRISTLKEIPSLAGCDFNSIIKANLIKVKEEKTTLINGIRSAASLLKLFPQKIRDLVLKNISAQEPKLALSIRYRLVEFEELFKLDPLSLQELLRNVNYSTLQYAMSVLGASQREFLYKNMSRKISDELKKDLAAMKPVEKSVVAKARQEILDVACSLADKEAIVLIAESGEKDK